MSVTEQRRALVLTRVVAGDLSPGDAATSLGCSERTLWRLLRRFRAAVVSSSVRLLRSGQLQGCGTLDQRETAYRSVPRKDPRRQQRLGGEPGLGAAKWSSRRRARISADAHRRRVGP